MARACAKTIAILSSRRLMGHQISSSTFSGNQRRPPATAVAARANNVSGLSYSTVRDGTWCEVTKKHKRIRDAVRTPCVDVEPIDVVPPFVYAEQRKPRSSSDRPPDICHRFPKLMMIDLRRGGQWQKKCRSRSTVVSSTLDAILVLHCCLCTCSTGVQSGFSSLSAAVAEATGHKKNATAPRLCVNCTGGALLTVVPAVFSYRLLDCLRKRRLREDTFFSKRKALVLFDHDSDALFCVVPLPARHPSNRQSDRNHQQDGGLQILHDDVEVRVKPVRNKNAQGTKKYPWKRRRSFHLSFFMS